MACSDATVAAMQIQLAITMKSQLQTTMEILLFRMQSMPIRPLKRTTAINRTALMLMLVQQLMAQPQMALLEEDAVGAAMEAQAQLLTVRVLVA